MKKFKVVLRVEVVVSVEVRQGGFGIYGNGCSLSFKMMNNKLSCNDEGKMIIFTLQTKFCKLSVANRSTLEPQRNNV